MTDTPASLTRSNLTRYARIDGASAALIALCDLVDSLILNDPRGTDRAVLGASIDRAAANVEGGQAWAAMVAVAGAPVGWCPAADCIALAALKSARKAAQGLSNDEIWARLPYAGGESRA